MRVITKTSNSYKWRPVVQLAFFCSILLCFSAQAISQVQLVSSHQGKLGYVVIGKTFGDTSELSGRNKIAKRLKLEKNEYCVLPISTRLNNCSSYLKTLLQDQAIVSELAKTSLSNEVSVLDSVLKIQGLINQQLRSQEISSLSDVLNIDRLVQGLVRKKLLSSINETSIHFLDLQIAYVVNQEYEIDSLTELWSEKASDFGSFEETEALADLHVLLWNLLEIVRSQASCPVISDPTCKYCGGDLRCIREAELIKKGFVQDVLYGIEQSADQNSQIEVGLRNDTIWHKYGINGIETMLDCRCQKLNSELTEKVDIQGGNILVSDDFVLINRDELELRYLDTACVNVQSRLNVFEIPWQTMPKDELSKSVTEKIKFFLTEDKKDVLWYGTQEPHYRYGEYRFDTDCHKMDLVKPNHGFSPFYHLDVSLAFVSPPNGESNKLYCLVAYPQHEDFKLARMRSGESLEYRNAIDSIRRLADKSFNKFKEEVQASSSGRPELIRINVPVLFEVESSNGYRFKTVYSFVNGVAETRQDKSLFYYPDYVSRINRKVYRYGKAKRWFEKSLRKKRVIPVNVEHYYGSKNGLHCIVKVLQRVN